MILIVDDEVWFVGSLQLAFEMEGFTTVIAKDPEQCMEIVSGDEPIDVVVLDVMIPPGSLGIEHTDQGLCTGLVLLKQIREVLPDVPVIISSVRTDLAVKGTENPPTMVLPKDETSPDMMIETVRRLISRRKKFV